MTHDTELLIRIGGVFGTLESVQQDLLLLGNRLETIVSRTHDRHVEVVAEVAELRGAIRAAESNIQALIAAAKSAGITVQIERADDVRHSQVVGDGNAIDQGQGAS